MTKTTIEWASDSWNPIRARHRITGKMGWHCEHVSPGCVNCYAEAMNAWRGTRLPFKPGHQDDIDIFYDLTIAGQPLKWKQPRTIFPCSMTDMFAGFVPDEVLDQMFNVMRHTPQHTYMVLTKRPLRMLTYVADRKHQESWPLSNVWLGISAEDQTRYEERMQYLVQTPAAKHFISFEPMLGPIELFDITNWRNAYEWWGRSITFDLAICGFESGRGRRPYNLVWAEQLLAQCRNAGIPFFMKQIDKKTEIPPHLMVREWPHEGTKPQKVSEGGCAARPEGTAAT